MLNSSSKTTTKWRPQNVEGKYKFLWEIKFSRLSIVRRNLEWNEVISNSRLIKYSKEQESVYAHLYHFMVTMNFLNNMSQIFVFRLLRVLLCFFFLIFKQQTTTATMKTTKIRHNRVKRKIFLLIRNWVFLLLLFSLCRQAHLNRRELRKNFNKNEKIFRMREKSKR